MQRNHHAFRRAIFVLLFLFFYPSALPLFAAEKTDARVQRVLKDIVGDIGQRFIGLGSWITGDGYNDPLLAGGTSDHDIKLVVPSGTTDDDALKAYKNARKTLTERIRKEFGADADKVLKSINIYPPVQLHGKIPDKTAAKNAFRKMGVVPNLGVKEGAPLTDDILEKTTKEGLFGMGSQSFIQWDEMKRGKVFYRDPKTGKVFTSIPDLEQMEAGWNLFTLDGEIKNAAHWSDNALSAFKQKNLKDMEKYVERTKNNLKKAKSMAGLKGTEDEMADNILKAIENLVGKDKTAKAAFYNNPNNRAIIEDFLNNPQNKAMIDDFIKGAKGELKVLEKIEKSVDAKEIKMFTEMMDDQGFMKNVKKFFKSDAFEYGLDGLFYAMMSVDAYNLYKKEGNLGLARAISRNANLTGMLTDAGLEAVTEGILDSAANVDCSDVAEGNFTTYGYQSVGSGLDLKKFSIQLPEYADMPDDKVGALALETDQVFDSKIKPEIEKYIKGNLTKGSSPTPLDTRLAEKVIDRCLPYLKNELTKMRKAAIDDKKEVLNAFRGEFLKIAITGFHSEPQKPRAGAKVDLEMKFNKNPEDLIKDLEGELKKKGAVNPQSLFISYAWKMIPDDPKAAPAPKEASSAANSNAFTPEKAATYKLQATVSVKSVMDIFSRWGKIDQSITKEFSLKVLPIEVEVPDLTGLDEEEAKTKLKAAGLELEKETVKTFSKGKDPEKVIEQDPKSKTKVDAGSKIKAVFNLPKHLNKVSIVAKTPIVLKPGETQEISVEVAYSNGEKEKPKKEETTWKSSRADVAVVDNQAGKVKTFSAGETELTVEFEKMKAQVAVEVTDWERSVECTVYKTDWQGKQTTSTVSKAQVEAAGKKGTTETDGKTLLTQFMPGSYTATVEAAGYKKAPPQPFKLTAAKDESEAKTPVKLSLYIQEERNLEELKISPFQFNATETGERRQLTATMTYSNGDEEEVTEKAKWESSNTKAAQVSKTGEVTIPDSANNGDQVTIKATYTFQGASKTGTSAMSLVLQSDVDFTVSPSPPKAGEPAAFSVNLAAAKNVRPTDTFRWKLRKFGEARQEEMGNGATISYTLPEQNRYFVEMTVLNSKGEEKIRKEKDFTTEATLKAISGTANEWRGTLQGNSLVVTSHPWNGQSRTFSSNPDFSRSFSNVKIYDLKTGNIKGAYNPGYVAYISGGCVRYFLKASSVISVGFSSTPLPPNLEFDRSIAKSCKEVAPDPQLQISQIKPFGFVVSWYDKKGGACSATVYEQTGELEGAVFCQGGQDLAVPALLLSPPSIDEDTEAKITVTNTNANPGAHYLWVVDGKPSGGSGTEVSMMFPSGSHTVKVSAENNFGLKKESYPLTFTVAKSEKKTPDPQTGTKPTPTPTGKPEAPNHTGIGTAIKPEPETKPPTGKPGIAPPATQTALFPAAKTPPPLSPPTPPPPGAQALGNPPGNQTTPPAEASKPPVRSTDSGPEVFRPSPVSKATPQTQIKTPTPATLTPAEVSKPPVRSTDSGPDVFRPFPISRTPPQTKTPTSVTQDPSDKVVALKPGKPKDTLKDYIDWEHKEEMLKPNKHKKPSKFPKPYNPLDDPNLKDNKAGKPLNLKDMKDTTGDFQNKLWSKLDSKTNPPQQYPQPIPDEYTKPPRPPRPIVPPRGPTTGPGSMNPPTTVAPGGIKPPITPPLVTSKGGLSDVTVNSRDITIHVWDHGIIDGDIINILLNGKVIPGGNRVTLAAKRKAFKLKLNSGKNRITIYAVNEGSDPPNTASLEISNVVQGKGQQQYSINQKTSTSFGATVVIPGSGRGK